MISHGNAKVGYILHHACFIEIFKKLVVCYASACFDLNYGLCFCVETIYLKCEFCCSVKSK